MEKTALFLFVKNPAFKAVKPALALSIGEENALKIYFSLLDITAQLIKSLPCKHFVFYEGEIIEEDFWSELAQKHLAIEGTWNERTKAAFKALFKEGFEKVIYIDSDVPTLTHEILLQSIAALDENDIVMGPSLTGGHYLLGMKQVQDEIFEGDLLENETPFAHSFEALKKIHQKIFLLDATFNVNDLQDLQKYLSFIMAQKNALNPNYFRDRPQ